MRRKPILYLVGLLVLLLALGFYLKNKTPPPRLPLKKTTQVKTQPSPLNIYAYTRIGMFHPELKNKAPRVYVPNKKDSSVLIIEPATRKIVEQFSINTLARAIVPSYDLKTLWILDKDSPSAAKPVINKIGKEIVLKNALNLYFTPDGQFAISVNERKNHLEFRDPQTMALKDSMPVNCKGLNYMDFTQDGHYGIATCKFSGQLVKFDVLQHKVVDYLTLGNAHTSSPQDIRLGPDGLVFYVADKIRDGVILIDANSFQESGFISTGIGALALYPSRNGRYFYVANQGCHNSDCKSQGAGSVTVIEPKTQRAIANWPIPGGGSPGMGGLNITGKELWLSGRYDNEIYVFDTVKGELSDRLPMQNRPQGLTFWPQPGRFSLGHTGNMR